MLLRVIKERWNEDGTPMVDLSKPHRPQLVNGGLVRINDPKTHQPRNLRPGETFELPDPIAKNLLFNAPHSVEPEERHQARLIERGQRDTARELERDALDALMRDMSRETEQAQKLRAMAEERERTLAAQNLRVAQAAQGKDSLIEEMKRQMADLHASYAAKLAALEARLDAPLPAADKPAEGLSATPTEPRSRKRVSG